MVGTPVTQARFMRRQHSKGTYGGTGWINEQTDTIPITTAATPLDGFLAGAYTRPLSAHCKDFLWTTDVHFPA